MLPLPTLLAVIAGFAWNCDGLLHSGWTTSDDLRYHRDSRIRLAQPVPAARCRAGAQRLRGNGRRAEALVSCFFVSQQTRRQRYNLAIGGILPLTKRFANAVEVMTVLCGMFGPGPADFGNNRIVVHSYKPNSSGEQSVGHAKPWLSTTSVICALVSALLICLKFQGSK